MGKYTIGLHTPIHFINKYIISKFNKRVKVKTEIRSLRKFVINVNNFCNRKCFSCVSLCDKPFNNPWRDKRREIRINDVKKAIPRILEYASYEGVTLAGGEPTAMNLIKLMRISKIIRDNELKGHILTNGFRIRNISPYNFDYIILDDHGTNTDDVRKSIDYFKELGYENYAVKKAYVHKDFNEARETPIITEGFDCNGWMQPTLWLDLVYPCCGMPQMEGWDNDTIIRDTLRKNGWTCDNPDLAEVLKNWRKTIPNEVVNKCLFSCWKFRKKYTKVNIAKWEAENETD
jgi:organic radical activating enzyme